MLLLAHVLMLKLGNTKCVWLGRGTKGVLDCMQAMAAACNLFTGAELAGLCREAAITALREDLQVAHLVILSMLLATFLHVVLLFAIVQQHLAL